ncbi:hypothetical protein Cflav_PD0573 [Pedosphaera parvula Ellin514]|uniref:Uncharacterized protein n=1 Tax=Pedosphaera parvula (strain Ellin514) TaxID=320771 RepID=B9XS20_PEDPL|nr:hypothetical protein Cflav_PD0573 [Pedosphaera parvula Ellin514]
MVVGDDKDFSIRTEAVGGAFDDLIGGLSGA